MSYQVVRVQTFNQGSLTKIGGEAERTSKHHRNQDIDDERTPLNFYFKRSDNGLNAEWHNVLNELNATYKKTKKSVAFEGMIITSDKAFFERLGWETGQPPNEAVGDFFERAYRFALREIGYHGTDANVLSAVVHMDETTPHLQLYYVPIVDATKKKVYARGTDGKVLRNDKGSPVQAKDEHGKALYDYIPLEQPKVCHSEFWDLRGGQLSYGNLQDDFHDSVGKRFGLGRGEIGSNKKHTTKYQWEHEQQQKALQEMEAKKQKLTDELTPLQEYIDAFHEALDGKKSFFKGQLEKQVTGLVLKYNELEKEHRLRLQDNESLFKQLQEYQRKIPALQNNAELVAFIKKYAPDEFAKAQLSAQVHYHESQTPKPKQKSNIWTK